MSFMITLVEKGDIGTFRHCKGNIFNVCFQNSCFDCAKINLTIMYSFLWLLFRCVVGFVCVYVPVCVDGCVSLHSCLCVCVRMVLRNEERKVMMFSCPMPWPVQGQFCVQTGEICFHDKLF